MQGVIQRLAIVCAIVAVVVLPEHLVLAEETDRDLPMEMVNFRFKDTFGDVHELYDYADRELIVLFSQLNGCPIVRQSYPYMREVRHQYASKGVKFLYFNSSDYDEDPDIIHEASDYEVSVPILQDWGQVLAHALEVERSGETFVVDPKTWKIIYRGMADDRFDYGLQRSNPQEFWLVDAIEAHLAGETPAVQKTIAKGCLYNVDLPSDVTFTEDVAPILDRKLAECVPGGKHPSWSALTPEQAEQHVDFVHEILLTRRVPSKSGCKQAGSDVTLTIPEVHTLLAWYYDVTGAHSEWFNAG